MNNFVKKKSFLFFSLGLSALVATTTSAQSGGAAPKITVGELLKKVKEESRGSKATQLQKSAVTIPDSGVAFPDRKPINLSEIKPPRISEIYKYENADQLNYEKTLNLQIDELYKLTQKFKGSPNRGELWVRLAELYVEKANILDNRKQDEYDARLKEFLAGRLKVKPVLDLSVAKEYNKKALQLYEWFLKEYPSDSKISQALFFLGYNHMEVGNSAAAVQFYNQLTSRFPKSPYAGEAHFAVGETFFDSEKWADAYKEYSFLIKDYKHGLHTLALYKAAWCLYRLGKTEEGIKYLDYIVKTSLTAKNNESLNGRKVNNARIENEALKDLIVFFADAGDPKRAIEYFNKNVSKKSGDYIEKLAYHLSDKGNKEAASEVFRYLIIQDSNSKKAFEFQYQIVQNFFFSKKTDEFKSELYKWIVNYNERSGWYLSHQSEAELLQKCNLLREQTLRNYILQQHQTAQNSRSAFSREAASEGYKLYFKEFEGAKASADMHFYYGELLYDMERFSDAAEEYRVVLRKTPEGEYAERSAQNVLLSIEKQLPKDDELQRKVGNSLEAVPIDEKISNFFKTASWYLQKYPKSERAAEINFRVGRLYYLTNNFDPAEKKFKEIIQQFPQTKFSEYSANLLLDIYNLKKDYAGLERAAAELLTKESISGSKVGQDIRGVLEKTSFKKAQSLESEKKFFEAANQFQQFAIQNPKSSLVQIAYYNSAINFERAGKTKEAIANYNQVAASADPQAKRIRANSKKFLAKIYQDSGMLEEAARLYTDLAKESPDDPLATSYLYNSAFLSEVLGKSGEAIEQYSKYLKLNKNREENSAIVFKIAQLQRQLPREVAALDGYRTYVDLPEYEVDKKIESAYWIQYLSNRLKLKMDVAALDLKINQALASRQKNKKDLTNKFLAKIKIMRAEETFGKLKQVLIPNVASKQKIAVDQKLEIMNNLNDQLAAVIKLDSAEEIVSALYISGISNEHMAQVFQSVPVPGNLNVEQKKQYLAGVEKILKPFLNKADESFKLTIERALDLQVYPEAYRLALSKMSKKFPTQYYNSEEVSSAAGVVDWMVTK